MRSVTSLHEASEESKSVQGSGPVSSPPTEGGSSARNLPLRHSMVHWYFFFAIKP